MIKGIVVYVWPRCENDKVNNCAILDRGNLIQLTLLAIFDGAGQLASLCQDFDRNLKFVLLTAYERKFVTGKYLTSRIHILKFQNWDWKQ